MTTTAAKGRATKATRRPRKGVYLTDGHALVQIRRSTPDYAMVEDAASPVDAPDLLCLSWERIDEAWKVVSRGA